MSADYQRTMTRQAPWTRFCPLQRGELDAYTRVRTGDVRNLMERIPE